MPKEAKAKLREKVGEALILIPENEKKRQSKVVLKKLFSLESFKNCKRLSVFLSIDNEIDTKPIVEYAFKEMKTVFVPRYSKNGMEMVRLLSMEDWENLPVTKWGIKQPLLKDNRENALETGGLDFIVAPGVAFTSNGQRCGHGGGYYDKFFSTVRKQPTPPSIVAVAFKEQIFDEIPFESSDQLVDTVLYAD